MDCSTSHEKIKLIFINYETRKTPISDLYVLNRKIVKDARGSFSRLFGEDDIDKAGRPTNIVHVNTSTSVEKGTLRGVHFQYPP